MGHCQHDLTTLSPNIQTELPQSDSLYISYQSVLPWTIISLNDVLVVLAVTDFSHFCT